MKTVIVIISVITMVILSSCNQKIDPNTMLEDSETRTELFDAIASNNNYMIEFMENMQDNNHAMQMMKGNRKMMGTMMKGQGMQLLMKDSMLMKDSTMMKNMMQSMMKDGKMMGNMMKMMHEKGMMSEDCLESCKRMMGNKGMKMNGTGKMTDK